MVQLLPIKDSSQLQKLNEHAKTNAGFGYVLYEKEEIKGFALYNICVDEAQMLFISYPDSASLDGLVRAVISSLSVININKIAFLNSCDFDELRKLSFITNSSNMLNNINEFLSGCKHCRK